MTKYLCIIFLLFSSNILLGNSRYDKIDRASKSVPDSLRTVEEIATHLTAELSEEDEKLRALYIWITHNIKYDLKKVNTRFWHNSYKEMVNETIATGSGISEHFAQLFHFMCKSIDIESFVISGYTPKLDYYKISQLNHTWNLVKIDQDYLFIDTTLDAGFIKSKGKVIHKFTDDHFLVLPEDFIKTHVPFDPMWQLLDNPISNVDFMNKDFSKLNKQGGFSYRDSILMIDKTDSITQIIKRISRIKKSGVTNELIKEEISKNEVLIEHLKYSAWISNCNTVINQINTARDKINLGISYDNIFISYMNKNFKNPKIEDSQIANTMERANKYFFQGKDQLKKAKHLINELDFSGKSRKNLRSVEEHTKRLIIYITELEHKLREIEPLIVKRTDYSRRYLEEYEVYRDMVPYE